MTTLNRAALIRATLPDAIQTTVDLAMASSNHFDDAGFNIFIAHLAHNTQELTKQALAQVESIVVQKARLPMYRVALVKAASTEIATLVQREAIQKSMIEVTKTPTSADMTRAILEAKYGKK